MLLYSGPTKTLAGRSWVAIEISEARTEEVTLHVARWMKRTLGGRAFELLFPVQSRDIDGIKLLVPYLLARTTNNDLLIPVSVVMGVEGLVDDGRDRPMVITDEWAQTVVRDSRLIASAWSAGVEKGSWVRVLMGPRRMLVGRVRAVSEGIADVRVQLRSRVVGLMIPTAALLNLGEEEREYYGNLS